MISYIILKYLKSFVIIFAILIICYLLLIKILFELVLYHKSSLLQVKEENEKFSLSIFFSFKFHLLIMIASNLLRFIWLQSNISYFYFFLVFQAATTIVLVFFFPFIIAQFIYIVIFLF